jgi:hypothetical protein
LAATFLHLRFCYRAITTPTLTGIFKAALAHLYISFVERSNEFSIDPCIETHTAGLYLGYILGTEEPAQTEEHIYTRQLSGTLRAAVVSISFVMVDVRMAYVSDLSKSVGAKVVYIQWLFACDYFARRGGDFF